MNRTDSLFILINSLSKTEKRYFKCYALMHGKSESNYITLFDAIEKQNQYDESLIKKQFAGKTFLKQFSVTKNYLYNLILKSMELYRQTNSVDAQIRSLLNRSDVLYEKAMYKECATILEKANTIAKKHELRNSILEILRLKRRVAWKMLDLKKIKSIETEESEALDAIEQNKLLGDLSGKIAIHYFTKGKTGSKKDTMKKYFDDPLLRDEGKIKTFIGKIHFLQCHTFHNMSIGNTEKLYELSEKMAMLYVSNPFMIRYDTYSYLVTLNNIISSCLWQKKMKELKFWVGHLQKAEKFSRNKTSQTYHWQLNYHVLNYYNLLGEFEFSREYCENKVLKNFEVHAQGLNQKDLFVLYNSIAKTYFGAGDFHKALTWLNRINNQITMQLEPDLRCHAKIFYLLVHFELQNFELMPYLIKSTYRFLLKTERLSPFQNAFLGFLRQFLKKEFDRKLLRNLFILFKQDAEKIFKNKSGDQAFEQFDYISWLESKIENKSFAQTIKSGIDKRS